MSASKPIKYDASKGTTEAKPWRLPFWTEPPSWAIERDQEEAQQAEAEAEEPLVLPTAEELETIRRNAYNEGLEQGLVEGRQQGHQEGFEQGQQEGHQQGKEQGLNEGQQEGFRAGEDQGRKAAEHQIEEVAAQLRQVLQQVQASLVEREQALPQVLSQLVMNTCQQVLQHELSQGTQSIQTFIERALQQLPIGSQHLHVFIHPDDMQYIEAEWQASHPSLKVSASASVAAGQCRLESDHTLIEYKAQDHLQQLMDDLASQLLQTAQDYPKPEELEAATANDQAAAPLESASTDAASNEAKPAMESGALLSDESAQPVTDEPLSESSTTATPDEDDHEPV